MDDEAMEVLLPVIRQLQAGQIAQARVIRALIASHPDPDAMRRAWHAYASPSIADAGLAKLGDPSRLEAHQAVADAIQDWDERLEQDLRRP